MDVRSDDISNKTKPQAETIKEPKLIIQKPGGSGSGIQNPPAYSTNPKRSVWKYLTCGGTSLLLILALCFGASLMLSSFTQISNIGQSSTRIQKVLILSTGNNDSDETRSIAVINISGTIEYSVPGASTQYSNNYSQAIIDQLRVAKEDKKVTAVLLRFNTPGGAVPAAEPICHVIKEVDDVKPVYSFIDAQGTSLGYLLPNCSRYIVSRPSAFTGSISVIVQAIDFLGILENFGGKVVFITNTEGDEKSPQQIFNPESEQYKNIQKILDETYEYFVNTVYEGRKGKTDITKDEIKTLADGRVFSGIQAKELRLVDEVGEFDDAIRIIIDNENIFKGKKVEVFEYSIMSNLFRDLLAGLNSNIQNASLEKQLDAAGGIQLLMRGDLVSPIK